jgi:hypothetical protein
MLPSWDIHAVVGYKISNKSQSGEVGSRLDLFSRLVVE